MIVFTLFRNRNELVAAHKVSSFTATLTNTLGLNVSSVQSHIQEDHLNDDGCIAGEGAVPSDVSSLYAIITFISSF
jgi:hypothetical protein